jgi:hypothetical protein
MFSNCLLNDMRTLGLNSYHPRVPSTPLQEIGASLKLALHWRRGLEIPDHRLDDFPLATYWWSSTGGASRTWKACVLEPWRALHIYMTGSRGVEHGDREARDRERHDFTVQCCENGYNLR